jgi:hypothetical protein
MTPKVWTDEDREEVVSAIVDGIITQMTLEEMRKNVWDALYEDLIWQEWTDLLLQAEDYAPNILLDG